MPLRAGANNYTVRLYGPHGEVEERRFTRFIGAELKDSYFKQAVANLRAASKPKAQVGLFAEGA